MRWVRGFCVILFYISRSATAELFKFDVSSLHPDELCTLTAIIRTDPTADLCLFQTHIQLVAGSRNPDDPAVSSKTTLIQKIKQVRNQSANRAVAVLLQSDASLVDPAVLSRIGPRIVEFVLEHMSQTNLTSNFPAIGLSNLLDLRFFYCRYPGLKLHKADFRGMKNIRAIEFKGTPLESVETGTFTDLPTLQTLALGNDLGDWDEERVAVWRQLNCDAKNAWLWQFLKKKPTLRKGRGIGKIFTLGNFTSSFLDMDETSVDCKRNGTAAKA